MSQSITHYVNVSVATEGAAAQPAGFGKAMLLYEHALESARLAGPFTSAAGVTDAGHVSGSPPHAAAQAFFAQQPHPREFYVGRRDAGDADDGEAFDAVVDENPAGFYAASTANRSDDELLAFAAAVNSASYPKIALLQSSAPSLLSGEGPSYEVEFVTAAPPPADGDYDLIFTGFGLVSPVTITVTVTGSVPANDTALGVALDAELDTAAGVAGDLEDVVDPASIDNGTGTVAFKILDGLPAGTVTTSPQAGTTMTATTLDADLGSRLFDLGYLRTALMYYPSDSVYADVAWLSRCLSFNLDQRKGTWSYKQLNGIAGSSLTDAQVSALRNVNANYFASAVATSGQATAPFTAQGWMSGPAVAGAGRRIDITTTLDWLHARIEEALINVNLRETHGVKFDDPGINRYVSAFEGVMAAGVAAGHILPFQVPAGEDHEFEQTPIAFAPKIEETTTTERTNRALTFSGLAYLQNYIERVIFSAEVRN